MCQTVCSQLIINCLLGFRLAEELDSFKSALEKKRERSLSRKRYSQEETSDTPREKRQKLDGPDSTGSDEREMREIEERIAEQEMIAQEVNKFAENVDNMKDGGEVSEVQDEHTKPQKDGDNAMDMTRENVKDRAETECEMSREVLPKSPSEQEAVVPQTVIERRLGVAVYSEFKPPRQQGTMKDVNRNDKLSNDAPLAEIARVETHITGSQQSKTSLDELLDEGLPNQSLAYMMASQPQYALHDPDVTPPRLRPAVKPQESCVKQVEYDMIQSTQPQYHLMQDTDSDSDHHDKESSTRQETHVTTHFIGGDNKPFHSMEPGDVSMEKKGRENLHNQNMSGTPVDRVYCKQPVAMETNEERHSVPIVTNQRSVTMETTPAYATDDQRVPGGSPPKPLPTPEEPDSPTMYPKTPGMSTFNSAINF